MDQTRPSTHDRVANSIADTLESELLKNWRSPDESAVTERHTQGSEHKPKSLKGKNVIIRTHSYTQFKS